MKSIIFGSRGYLGSNLNQFLINNDIETCIYDSRNNEKLDLTEANNFKNINWDVDNIYLMAGRTGTYKSFSNYDEFLKSNELILLNILNSIRNTKYRPRIIFPSTRLIYKGSDYLLKENSEKETKTLYAVNKLACENFLKAYSNTYSIPYTIIRISIPYGNMIGTNYSYGTIGNFISNAIQDKITLFGDGNLRRTFTHIKDICRIFMLIASSKKTINKVLNMPGEEYKLKEIAYLIAKKYSSKVEFINWPKNYALIESGHTVFDSSYLRSLLNTDIEKNFLEWIKNL